MAAVAVARKLACLAWQLLTNEQDYAYGRPSLLRAKIRTELAAGAQTLAKRHSGQRISASPQERDAERRLTKQAEAAYQRLIADWQATGQPKRGTGATRGHASQRPPEQQAARQAQHPTPTL